MIIMTHFEAETQNYLEFKIYFQMYFKKIALISCRIRYMV